MSHKVITTSTQLATILTNIKDEDRIDLWSVKPLECVNHTVSEIGERWQHSMDPRLVMSDTFEYLLYKVMTESIDWYEYNKLVTAYNKTIPGLDGDQIYEFSVKTLANAGYIF